MIVVLSPDTDVLVLLLHHRPIIKSAMLFMLTRKEGKNTDLSRFIPIHTVYKMLSAVSMP